MIKIEITDPSTSDPVELRAVAEMLLKFSNAGRHADDVASDPFGRAIVQPGQKPYAATKPARVDLVVATPAIAPVDSPAAGAPNVDDAVLVFQAVPDPAQVFGTVTTLDPAQVFGGAALPNGAPSIAAASLPAIAPGGMPVTSTTGSPVPPPLVPQPAPGAPIAAAPPASLVDVDKDGLPWDERIHSNGRSKVVNGTWKLKRGMDAAVVDRIKAELRAVMALAPSVPLVSSPTVAAIPTPPSGVPSVPAPSVTTAAPVSGFDFSTATTFAQLVGEITKATAAGRITLAQVTEECKKAGLPGLPLLNAAPQLVPQIAAGLHALATAA